MYESQTYEIILNRMMARVAEAYPNLDTREGSMLFNALASAAIELSIAYVALDNTLSESFVRTATREYLFIACDQMGMDTSIFASNPGTFRGTFVFKGDAQFDAETLIGTRWNCDLYNYVITELISSTTVTENDKVITTVNYQMICETYGASPNGITGALAAITYLPSELESAQLVECLIKGEDEYTDDEIRQAYFDFVNSTASDGNVGQYERWCGDYESIGNYKIIPLWNGANTVKVSILDANNRAATATLVDEFQEYLDPIKETFVGDGIKTTFKIARMPSTITSVTVGETTLSASDYSYNTATWTLTLKSAPADDAVVSVVYPGGMGNGEAPIGAFVTVTTATELPVNITANVKLSDGYTSIPTTSINGVEHNNIDLAVTDFLASIAYKKAQVSYMSLGAAILDVPGVEFVDMLTLNGESGNVDLTAEQIAVLGTTKWTVVTE